VWGREATWLARSCSPSPRVNAINDSLKIYIYIYKQEISHVFRFLSVSYQSSSPLAIDLYNLEASELKFISVSHSDYSGLLPQYRPSALFPTYKNIVRRRGGGIFLCRGQRPAPGMDNLLEGAVSRHSLGRLKNE